jgi:hypothetical protein
VAPVVRIDDDVWEWLKSHAKPLEDTPNSVLRRIAGLDRERPANPVTNGQFQSAGRGSLSSHSVQGTHLLKVFLDELKASMVEVEPQAGRQRGRSNLFKTRARNGFSQLWYIKTRSEGSGFWGLTPNLLDFCKESGLPWRVILLIGPKQCGYVLTPEAVKKNQWNLPRSGQYKVHERDNELKGAQEFNSYSDLVTSVLADVAKGS